MSVQASFVPAVRRSIIAWCTPSRSRAAWQYLAIQLLINLLQSSSAERPSVCTTSSKSRRTRRVLCAASDALPRHLSACLTDRKLLWLWEPQFRSIGTQSQNGEKGFAGLGLAFFQHATPGLEDGLPPLSTNSGSGSAGPRPTPGPPRPPKADTACGGLCLRVEVRNCCAPARL